MGIGSLRRILVFQDVKKLIPIPILKCSKKLLGMVEIFGNVSKKFKSDKKLEWKDLF